MDSNSAIRGKRETYDTKKDCKELITQLMKPVETLAGNKEDWIMVPDGLFFQLPIESLPGDESGNMFIEKHSMGYEFSSRFITG